MARFLSLLRAMDLLSPRSFFEPTLCVALALQLPGQSAPPADARQEPRSVDSKQDVGSKPWRLHAAFGGPSWLTVSGEQRSRLESLDNQFRGAANGNRVYADHDDVFAMRTALKFDMSGETLGGVLEILDARQFGLQADSYVDTTMVNAADVLQAFGSMQLGELGNGRHELRAGRQAVDLGSRRLVARNAFRNSINSFTGADWIWNGESSSVRAFWFVPVDRLPSDSSSLRNNEWELDSQDADTQFAGAYHAHKLSEATSLDTYVFWLGENAADSRMRDLLTFGFRLCDNYGNYQPTKREGAWFYEMEAAGQQGESKTNIGAATPISDHQAWFAHVSLGYAFDAPWKPAVQVAYDHATGDSRSNDGKNGRFDTLFGARRFEYGPTGIYGAIARANLVSPELRLLLQPVAEVQCMMAWRGAWLAEERDAWTASGPTPLRDPTGASGTHVGDQIEGRVRWDVIPKSFDVEVGFAVLFDGSFQEQASGGQSDDVYYGYLQTTWKF